jgi:glycosyltransferase involved in cell wall biosynthesis
VVFPITYPYAHNGRAEFNGDRPYKFIFVGRWCKSKFHPDVKKFMEESGIKMDYVFVNHIDGDYSPETVAKTGIKDANVGQIEEYFRKTKYLLVPSTTECITLVAGEALANGCIPVTLESYSDEHEQFVNCLTAQSVSEFNSILAELEKSGSDPKGIDRKRAFEFTNRMWSIEKSIEELGTIFGAGKNGTVKVLADDNGINGPGFRKTLPYINATIITGETAD